MTKKYTLITSLFLIISCNFLFSQDATFNELSYAEAVNISGRQRMLSQRITKLYLLNAYKIDTLNSKKEYHHSIELFQLQLNLLKDNSINSEEKVKEKIKLEESFFNSFLNEIALDKKVSLSSLTEVSTNLLKICDQVVTAIEMESKKRNFSENEHRTKTLTTQVETVNISGKQRMLSQQLAVYLTLNKFNKSYDYIKKIKSIRKEQIEAVNFLVFNSLNTATIEKALGKISLNHEQIQKLTASFNEYDLTKILPYTNEITEQFDSVTKSYTNLYFDK